MSVSVRLALAGLIAAGVLLRIVAPGTTVFCNDQARACALAEDIAAGRWESAGLVNSGGFRNAPGFAYVLAGAWWLYPRPLTLLYLIVAANVLALGGAAFLSYRMIGARGTWWAMTLFATAPWAIQYCRWIWAQDLMFPLAVLLYAGVYAWVCRGRRYAAAGVVLALAALVQIHLAGVVLLIALGLLLMIRRQPLPLLPIALAVVVALAVSWPYLAAGHLRWPAAERLGYQHFWRMLPGALMSVSGLGWSLEFRSGYAGLAQYFGWRQWPYLIATSVPALLLVGGTVWAALHMWRQRHVWHAGHADERACGVVVGLVLLIPLSFSLLALRTSPTYFPLWYPLPFIIMGWAAAHLTAPTARPWLRRTATAALLLAAVVQLAFFGDQLVYIRGRGGVPDSPLDRSYAGTMLDCAALARQVDAREVWLEYGGSSRIMDEATAYALRRAAWHGQSARRVLIRFQPPWEGGTDVRVMTADEAPASSAYLVHPWHGPQQRDGRIPHMPAGDEEPHQARPAVDADRSTAPAGF